MPTPATSRVRVEDHGPGLPEAELAPIFDLFYRSNVNARRASGTGIGLYVVRQLVHAMQGTVSAYAVEPHGLGFLVELPADAAIETEVSPAAPTRLGTPGLPPGTLSPAAPPAAPPTISPTLAGD